MQINGKNRALRNKPIYFWSINLQQRRLEYIMEERQSNLFFLLACIVVYSFCPRQTTAKVFYLSISCCYFLDLGLLMVLITFIAETKEDLKSLIMKMKEERGKACLKLNIQKTKIIASLSITSWQTDGEALTDFIFSNSKITADK